MFTNRNRHHTIRIDKYYRNVYLKKKKKEIQSRLSRISEKKTIDYKIDLKM